MSERKEFDPEKLADLLARVMAAGGSERYLDADIFIGLDANIPAGSRIDSEHGMVGWWPLDAPYESARDVPRYTASIDAALALVERFFPLGEGWNYTMAAAYGSFSIIPNDGRSTGIHDRRCGHARGAKTIPLAILESLLRALSALSSTNEVAK